MPFLEYENQRAEQRPKASPLAVLEILFRQPQQALRIFDLQGPSGMDPVRYADALKGLRDAGYITIEGEAPEQTVSLTERGREVVRLAKPA